MRDCNSCKWHKQGEHPDTSCQACIASFPASSKHYLPFWGPKMETLEKSDLSPHAIVSDYKIPDGYSPRRDGISLGTREADDCTPLLRPADIAGDVCLKPPGFVVKDSGERKQFASGMVRDTDENKVKYHLVASGPMLKRWGAHLTAGAKKYSEDNWMKADGEAEYNRFRASAFRHFMQWFYGDRDEDHASAVFFNVNGAEYVREKIA